MPTKASSLFYWYLKQGPAVADKPTRCDDECAANEMDAQCDKLATELS